jgi:hypothetical protein
MMEQPAIEAIESPEYMKRGFVHEARNDTANGPMLKPRRPRLDAQRYQVVQPWDIRLHRWIRSWWIYESDYAKTVSQTAWIRRVRFWIFGYKNATYGQYEKARKFVIAVTGGTTSEHEHAMRMAVCYRCPSLRVRLKKNPGGDKLYCGSCGCANWMLSELRVKNRLRRHYCPENRHHGTAYPYAWVLDRVRTMQGDLDELVKPAVEDGGKDEE